MVVSDIVLNRPLPNSIKHDADLYSSCIAGALLRKEYLRAVRQAGFARVEILRDRTYAAQPVTADPVTKDAAGALQSAAASITVLAQK